MLERELAIKQYGYMAKAMQKRKSRKSQVVAEQA